MKRVLSVILFLLAFCVAEAQIPYFSKTIGKDKLYAYTSLKAKPGINSFETYTTFQYGINNILSAGVDLSTTNGNSYFGTLLRYGCAISKYFNFGLQVTPSFSLNDNFKFSYLTSALYMNGNIVDEGGLFWCSNTWWGVNRGATYTLSQWTYLGCELSVGKKSSITPMVGEIHSWRFDQDLDISIGAYYSVKRYNLYLWCDNLLRNHIRLVLGFDVAI